MIGLVLFASMTGTSIYLVMLACSVGHEYWVSRSPKANVVHKPTAQDQRMESYFNN